ncbi:MAG: HAD family phosphatase, partial [Agathobacter sp.]|nr:HAD family phosphatase [Agathobacter sp.]
MIRNIIFDIGKVLVSYEPDDYMESLGISREDQKKINAAMFENKLWDESDQGLRTPDEFLQAFIQGAPELADTIRKLHTTVGNTVELLPYAMDWILDMKARGYHVYILSNYGENMLNQTEEKLAFLPLMDGVVFSYRIKKLKPDP